VIVDLLEVLVVMRLPFLLHLETHRRVRDAELVHPHFDQRLNVIENEDLLRQVEVPVDVAERRQVDDDGGHLLLGLARILREDHIHGGPILQRNQKWWIPSRARSFSTSDQAPVARSASEAPPARTERRSRSERSPGESAPS